MENTFDISSRERISTDVGLRNLFHLGYNSKSISKNVVNSIKFENVINTIKSYIENEELSVKSCGPLLLGLARVYDKQIKSFLEELLTVFKIKSTKSNNGGNEEEHTKKSKSVRKINNNEKTNDETLSSFNLCNNILSLSPLNSNDGLLSLLNFDKDRDKSNGTPSRQTTDLKNYNFTNTFLNTNSVEAFRADQSISSKSKFNMNTNFRNFSNPKEYFDENDNQDVDNFFQFITEKNRNEAGVIPPLDFNIENGLNVLNDITNEEYFDKKLNFINSESKTFMNMYIDNSFADLPKFKKIEKKKTVNLKLEYDEKIESDLIKNKNIIEYPENINEVYEKFKCQLRNSDKLNFDSLLSCKMQYNKHKKINFLFDVKTDDIFINHFAQLDMKDFNSEGVSDVKEKINKIIEEEKLKIDSVFDVPNDAPNNYDDELINNENIQDDNLDGIKNSTISFNEEVQLLIKKEKKKEIKFMKVVEKIDLPAHQVFYDLLCLAQKENIQLIQKNICDNSSIIIS